jgi:DnaK suppressor protein
VAAKSKAVKGPAKAAAAAKPKAAAAKATKPAAKPAAKPAVKPVAKSAAKPTAKTSTKAVAKSASKAVAKPKAAAPAKKAVSKSVAKPSPKVAPKPAAKPASKLVKPVAKPVAKTQAAAKSKPAVIANKAVSTVKSITQAIVGLVKPGAAKPAAASAKPSTAVKKPEPIAAKVAATPAPAPAAKPKPVVAAASTATGNTMKPSVTKAKGGSTSEGGRARAVAPNRPAPQSEPLVAHQVVRVDLPEGYKPSAKEEYMCPEHLEYFRQKLINWRAELVEESKQTIDNLREEVRDVGDEAERATRETENSLELRTRDRYRKLISKIEKALKRVDDGSYGYCEETGEEIGVDRLEARPIATLCLDAQERWEHRQKLMGD